MQNISDKFVEKIKTHILCSITFLQTLCHLRDNEEKYLHLPSAQLKVFQRGVYFSGIKAYNHLPINIKELLYDVKCFKPALKTFFQINSCYSLEEYFNFNPK